MALPLRTASVMYSVCAQFPFLCLAKNDEEREHKERAKREEREEGNWARRAGQRRCNT